MTYPQMTNIYGLHLKVFIYLNVISKHHILLSTRMRIATKYTYFSAANKSELKKGDCK